MVALPTFTNKTWELLSGVSADPTRIRTRALGKCVRFGQSGRKSLVFSNNIRRHMCHREQKTKGGDEGRRFSKSREMERKEEKREKKNWNKTVEERSFLIRFTRNVELNGKF